MLDRRSPDFRMFRGALVAGTLIGIAAGEPGRADEDGAHSAPAEGSNDHG